MDMAVDFDFIVIIFKIVQFLILVVFAFYISGFRKRSLMVPIVGREFTIVLKLCYIIPVFVYAYILISVEKIFATDLLAMALSIIGTALVMRARKDLKLFHTWAGYCRLETKLVTTGIYAYIRHPIYAGVYFFIFGGLTTIAPHLVFGGLIAAFPALPLVVQLLAIGSLIYGMGFIAFVASRESRILQKALGEEYARYREQIHAFLPLRKFKPGK